MLSFLILLSLLWYGFGGDQSWFSYCAWVWRTFGQPPYIAEFEQNFPGVFIIHYFVQATLGESMTAFRVFDLAWQTATALSIYLVATRIFKNPLAGLLSALLYSVYYVNLGLWHTGERDGFLLLLYLSSFLLLTRKGKERPGIFAASLCGLLLGFGFLVKPVAAMVGAVFAGLILKSCRSKLFSLLTFLASAALPFVACLIYYWRLGGLHDFLNGILFFNYNIYLDYGLSGFAGLLNGLVMRDYLLSNLVILSGAILLLLLRKNIPDSSGGYVIWLLLILAGSYAGYLFQAKYAYHFYYHQAPVWGALCVFAGAGWALGIDLINAKWKSYRAARTAIFAAAVIGCSVGLMRPEIRSYLAKALRHSPDDGRYQAPYYLYNRQVADYVQKRTGPEDRVQVWGGELGINYFSRRRAPSRFANTLHLVPFRPGRESLSPMQKQYGAELLASLEKTPPAYFIVSVLPYIKIDNCKTVLVQDYPELWQFVMNNYLLEKNVAGYVEIYRLKK
jgi:hypothetical protein